MKDRTVMHHSGEALGCTAFIVDGRAVRRHSFEYIACAKLDARTVRKSFAVFDNPNSRKFRA